MMATSLPRHADVLAPLLLRSGVGDHNLQSSSYGIMLGSRVRVVQGRQFRDFGGGDAGVVARLNQETGICEVMFDGCGSPLPVALRHLEPGSPRAAEALPLTTQFQSPPALGSRSRPVSPVAELRGPAVLQPSACGEAAAADSATSPFATAASSSSRCSNSAMNTSWAANNYDLGALRGYGAAMVSDARLAPQVGDSLAEAVQASASATAGVTASAVVEVMSLRLATRELQEMLACETEQRVSSMRVLEAASTSLVENRCERLEESLLRVDERLTTLTRNVSDSPEAIRERLEVSLANAQRAAAERVSRLDERVGAIDGRLQALAHLQAQISDTSQRRLGDAEREIARCSDSSSAFQHLDDVRNKVDSLSRTCSDCSSRLEDLARACAELKADNAGLSSCQRDLTASQADMARNRTQDADLQRLATQVRGLQEQMTENLFKSSKELADLLETNSDSVRADLRREVDALRKLHGDVEQGHRLQLDKLHVGYAEVFSKVEGLARAQADLTHSNAGIMDKLHSEVVAKGVADVQTQCSRAMDELSVRVSDISRSQSEIIRTHADLARVSQVDNRISALREELKVEIDRSIANGLKSTTACLKEEAAQGNRIPDSVTKEMDRRITELQRSTTATCERVERQADEAVQVGQRASEALEAHCVSAREKERMLEVLQLRQEELVHGLNAEARVRDQALAELRASSQQLREEQAVALQKSCLALVRDLGEKSESKLRAEASSRQDREIMLLGELEQLRSDFRRGRSRQSSPSRQLIAPMMSLDDSAMTSLSMSTTPRTAFPGGALPLVTQPCPQLRPQQGISDSPSTTAPPTPAYSGTVAPAAKFGFKPHTGKCSCGHPFEGDAQFCRICGMRRQSQQEVERDSLLQKAALRAQQQRMVASEPTATFPQVPALTYSPRRTSATPSVAASFGLAPVIPVTMRPNGVASPVAQPRFVDVNGGAFKFMASPTSSPIARSASPACRIMQQPQMTASGVPLLSVPTASNGVSVPIQLEVISPRQTWR